MKSFVVLLLLVFAATPVFMHPTPDRRQPHHYRHDKYDPYRGHEPHNYPQDKHYHQHGHGRHRRALYEENLTDVSPEQKLDDNDFWKIIYYLHVGCPVNFFKDESGTCQKMN